jgi:hypothetical protein
MTIEVAAVSIGIFLIVWGAFMAARPHHPNAIEPSRLLRPRSFEQIKSGDAPGRVSKTDR